MARERIRGGLASGRRPSDFPKAALRKGTKVELEHVVVKGKKPTRRDLALAQEIAMDHLVEDVRYYDFLAQAERKMERTRGRRRRNPEDDYLYHITFYSALPSIEEHGLQPGRGRGIGGGVYDTHRQGAIFLTDADGVRFWAARAEQWGQSQSDNLYEDELVPVLLRVRESEATRCELDEIGSRDARADAFKCRSSIDPEDLQLWAGVQGEGKWVDLEDFDEIPFAEAFDPEDDEDGETIWWLKGGGGGSPLVPTELNPRRGRRAARRPGRARRRNPMRSPPPGFLEGSKVRGELFHGTDAPVATGHSLLPSYGSEFGIYLSPRHRYARQYGRNLVVAVANIKRPIIVDSKAKISPRNLTARDIAKLKRQGYDGIVVRAPSGAPQEVVAFHKSQVWVTEVRR